jgi:glycosyltransferase involved in cell wall biosynthesis
VLPTGIPVERFRNGDGLQFRARHGIEAERRVALYVGRIAHEKNIPFLLEAADHARRLLPEFLLLIAGEGPALPGLRRMAEKRGLEQHVRFVGYLDRESELPHCYAAADVFAFSSRTETQGLVLLEAMAAGIPVYALAAMGTCDIVGPQRGAVAAPDQPEAFGTGLAALLADAPRLRRLAGEAHTFAETWSAPERARQLAELYGSLIADGSRRSPHRAKSVHSKIQR